MIKGLLHTGWIQSTAPATKAAPASTPAAVEAPSAIDRYRPAALASAPLPSAFSPQRLLQAAVALAQRVCASLLPFGHFIPTFTASSGPDIPKDFLAACGKRPERARALLQKLETLPSQEREPACEQVRKLVKGSGSSIDASVTAMIDEVSSMPAAAVRLSQTRELVSLSSIGQALTDLRLAKQVATASAVAPETTLSLVISLRDADPGRKSDYPRYDDLRAPLEFLTATADAGERDARMAQINRFQGSKRGPSNALPFVQAVAAYRCDDAEKARVRDVLRGILKDHGTREDPNLLAALGTVDSQHPLEGVQIFKRFLDEVKKPPQALDDLRLAHAIATTGKIPLSEAAEHVLALRQAEPSRKEDYRSFTPLRAVLEHVVAQPDRTAARERLIALQQKRATADEVLGLERGLLALNVTDEQRGAIRADMTYILGRCKRDERSPLAGLLPALDGRADAHIRVATLKTLYDLDARRLPQAISDLQLAATAAEQHKVAFDVAASRLVDLREQDKGRKEDYPSFANLAAPLQALLAGGGGSRDDLARLAVNGRTPEQALPHMQRLQKMPGTDAERQVLRDEWRVVLKGYGARSDPSLLAALDLVNAPDAAETRQRLTCLGALLSLLKRPEQGLADLRLAVSQAASSGRPFADAAKTVTMLRDADPGRKEDYPSFANLEAVAAYVLNDKRPIEVCVHDLQALQAKGRTPADAFEHDQKLAAMPVSGAARAAVRATYVGILKKTRRNDDSSLRALLEQAGRTTAPAAVMDAFAALLARTRKVSAASGDVGACVRRASGPVPVEEFLRHALTLRESDPDRRSDYPSWQSLDGALDFVAAAADERGRQARCELLSKTMKAGLTPASALPHAQRLDALKVGARKDAVVSAWLKVLGKSNGGPPSVLDLVDGHDDAVERVEAFGRLVKIGRRGWERGSADMQTCVRYSTQVPSVPFAEIAGHVQAIRAAREDGTSVSLDQSLPSILAGADERERKGRLQSYLRLLESGQGNTPALSWLVSTPGDPLPQATTTLLRLNKRMKRSSDGEVLRNLFTQVEKAAKDEPQSWLARWVRWPRTFERITWRLLTTQSGPDTVKYLDALQRGRFEGEPFKQTYERLQSLLGAWQRGDRAELLAEAFAGVNRPMVCGTLDATQRWSMFESLLKEVKSASAASTVWKGMSTATTQGEMEARRAAWPSILAACKDSAPAAADAYDALVETLDGGDRIDAELPHLVTLCKQQKPAMVPATWRSLHKMKGLSDVEKADMRDILRHASSPGELDRLWSLATTPVGDESLRDRAAILSPLLSSTHSVGWSVGAVGTLRERLGADAMGPTGAAVSGLASVLYAQGHPSALEAALQAIDWGTKLRIDGSSDPTVPELLTELGAALLLNEDLEEARAHVATRLSQRRKEAGGAGRVEIGETEVVVGGIKIKKRAEGMPSA